MPRRALDLGYEFRFSEVGPALEDAVGRTEPLVLRDRKRSLRA